VCIELGNVNEKCELVISSGAGTGSDGLKSESVVVRMSSVGVQLATSSPRAAAGQLPLVE
jgi:hypothetical protein